MYVLKIDAIRRVYHAWENKKVVIRFVYYFIVFDLHLASIILFLSILNLPLKFLAGNQEYLQYLWLLRSKTHYTNPL